MGRVVFLLLWVLGFVNGCNQSSKDDLALQADAIEKARVLALKQSDAYENLIELHNHVDNWYHKTTEYHIAQQQLQKFFHDYHLAVKKDSTLQERSLTDSCYMEILNPLLIQKHVQIDLLNYNLKTQDVEVQAPIIYIRTPEITNTKKLLGKIVVLSVETIDSLSFYVEKLKYSGLLALLITQPKQQNLSCFTSFFEVKFPIVGLSQEDSYFLEQSLKKKPRQYGRIRVVSHKEKVYEYSYKISGIGQGKRKILLLVDWSPNRCNDGIITAVLPSLMLLDIARISSELLQNSEVTCMWVPSVATTLKDLSLSHFNAIMVLNHAADIQAFWLPKQCSHLNAQLAKILSVYGLNQIVIQENDEPYISFKLTDELFMQSTQYSNEMEWINREIVLRSTALIAILLKLIDWDSYFGV